MFSLSITALIVWLIIVVGAAAIAVAAIRAMKVTIPDWVVQMFWIVVIALVAILAIHIIVGVARMTPSL